MIAKTFHCKEFFKKSSENVIACLNWQLIKYVGKNIEKKDFEILSKMPDIYICLRLAMGQKKG